MYREIETRAHATPGVIGLRLYVEKENTRAQETYAALGMEPAYYSLYQSSWAELDRSGGAKSSSPRSGTHLLCSSDRRPSWIPAFAGMTSVGINCAALGLRPSG